MFVDVFIEVIKPKYNCQKTEHAKIRRGMLFQAHHV
jgi:hypothetical protein